MLSEEMVQLGAKRSCIRELFEYGLRQAAAVGSDNVFDYSLGNPSVPAPAGVNAAIRDILAQEESVAVHGYTPAPGNASARAAVADDLNRRFSANIRPENLFFTCGAAPALISVLRALATPNSEFLVLAPYFPEYLPFIQSCGGTPVVVPADVPRFQICPDEVASRLTPRTQAVLVNSPNNPSGVVYSRETLTRLAAILQEKEREYGHPIYLIADEPYRELVYDGAEVPFLPTLYPDAVVCYSYSKSLSLPGERIGYVCVPDQAADSARLMNAVAGAARAMGHVCAPSLMQRVIACCAAVRPDIQSYDRNRQTLYQALTGYGYSCVKPDGAFYMLVRAPGGDSAAFSQRAKEKNLLVVPGDDFGCPEYVRISTCVSHDMIVRSLPVFAALLREASPAPAVGAAQ